MDGMAMRVHGHPLSPPTRRVMVALEEKALDYEFVLVDLRTAQHKTDSFLLLNPFAQVPALEDADFKLFESRAITRYISEVYADRGTPLLPTDSKKRTLVGVWGEVESLRFDVPGSRLTYEILIKPLLGETTDDAAVEVEEKKLAAILDVYEKQLSERTYLAGEEFSLADLHHIPVLDYLYGTKVKALFEARPRVKAWSEELLRRPAWKNVTAKFKLE